jgi:N-acetyl sugar amidotransferase
MSEAYFNLPSEIRFCRRCVMSNQRPCSIPEFTHTRERKGAAYLNIGEDGVCDACRHAMNKPVIDWETREKELLELLDQHRSKDGSYDCICPGSGGKDSVYAAHVLKYKYKMNPLTVTWPPILYTTYGYENFMNWIKVGGFDNISFNQNGRVQKTLTRLSIQNLLHPFQTFILGQKNLAPRIAAKWGIPLVFYGENEAEYGNPVADNETSLRSNDYYALKDPANTYLAGTSLKDLEEKHGLTPGDLAPYLPVDPSVLSNSKIEVHYLGYYLKWTPQEAYYYSAEHTAFKARPFRTQGTYSKYNSLDDKIDDLHYYTTHIKYGLGRASYDASQEIRNNHLTREEGVALVKRFDGEFPDRYFDEIMEYLEMTKEEFDNLCDEFRSPHLWEKKDGKWALRKTVFSDEAATAGA